MIEQSKGKDLNKVPTKQLEAQYYASIKYDGNYVQIHKVANAVKFFTSGDKEFHINELATKLIANNPNTDFVIEAEYIANSSGKLGDRTKAAKLTTYRTEFEKDLISTINKDEKFMVFDIISWQGVVQTCTFAKRLELLKAINLNEFMEQVTFELLPLQEAQKYAETIAKRGYEGVYLKSPSHIYRPGKRQNTAIKLKLRPTADLLCVDVENGEGKYTGMIGALVLKDKNGRVVRVGSGLSDEDRAQHPDYFRGKIVEVEYEQILDTYIQPTFKSIREDKEDYE